MIISKRYYEELRNSQRENIRLHLDLLSLNRKNEDLKKDNETQIVIIKERNRQLSKYIYRDQKIDEFLKGMLNASNIELSQIKIINYIQEYVELLDKKLKIK